MDSKNKKRIGIVLGALAVIILGIAIYFTFFFSYECDDLGCFKSHLKKCVPTNFVKNTETTKWDYTIKGKEDGKCVVETKILTVKKGSVERKNLEGKSMNCYLELGRTRSPESDLSKCHGILKEEIQAILIKNLHSQIRENLGKVQKSMQKIVK